MLDADKLRRVWPLGGVFCLLQTLDLSGNLIHALEPSQLSGLTQLRELNLARNRLRSLRGIDVLAGSLVCLDAGGNLVESLSDKGVHRCRLLEALDLSGNNLRSPQDVQGLSGLPHLTRLDLRVNPVSNAPSSRLFAVFHLRSVAVLDATPVTEAERQAVRTHHSFTCLGHTIGLGLARPYTRPRCAPGCSRMAEPSSCVPGARSLR